VTAKNVSQDDMYYVPGIQEIYNTVLLAIGREPSTNALNLEAADVRLSDATAKILVNEADQTSAKHIYAVGDCADGRSELAPLAVSLAIVFYNRLNTKN